MVAETSQNPQTTEFNPQEYKAYSGNRDVALKALLGTDYAFAHDSGLINLFYFDPETGEDGLMHVLGGEYLVDSQGTKIARGFHHEPSAVIAWQYDTDGQRLEQPTTYVDRAHLEGRNYAHRKDFIERPYAPYHARVVIDGVTKVTAKKDDKTGEARLVVTNNRMFPNEYDALAVLQTVRQAFTNRDKQHDVIDLENHIVTTQGEAPMLDGQHKMTVRLVLDADSGKIMSAYPLARGGRMNLSKDEIRNHLGLRDE